MKRTAGIPWLALLVALTVLASTVYCGLSLTSFSAADSTVSLIWLSALNGNANLIVAGVIWLALFGLIVARARWTFSIAWVLVPAICVVMGTFLLWLNRASYLGSAILEDREFHLVEKYDWYSRWSTYALCECPKGVACRCHNFYQAYSPIIGVKFSLVANDSTGDLVVRLNGSDLYVYGSSVRCYEQPDIIDYCGDQ